MLVSLKWESWVTYRRIGQIKGWRMKGSLYWVRRIAATSGIWSLVSWWVNIHPLSNWWFYKPKSLYYCQTRHVCDMKLSPNVNDRYLHGKMLLWITTIQYCVSYDWISSWHETVLNINRSQNSQTFLLCECFWFCSSVKVLPLRVRRTYFCSLTKSSPILALLRRYMQYLWLQYKSGM